MIKQLKVYEIEELFPLPKIDCDDWSNYVSIELANNGFDFLSRLSLSLNKLYRLTDLVEFKKEVINASNTKFKNKKTYEFVNSVFNLYSLCDHLVEYSDYEDSEDIVVISHRIIDGNNKLCLFILNKIMNIILSEREIIEKLSKELISFDYSGIADIILSEDKLFSRENLDLIQDEINHALRYKFLSEKTMKIVNFLDTLSKNTKHSNNRFIFLMDILKIKV
jgi:hypothetical protein